MIPTLDQPARTLILVISCMLYVVCDVVYRLCPDNTLSHRDRAHHHVIHVKETWSF